MINNIHKRNEELINITNDIIYEYRVQNFNKAARLLSSWISKVSGLLSYMTMDGDICSSFISQLTLVISDVIKAQEQNDYIFVADILEINMIPLLYSLQTMLRNNSAEEIVCDYFDSNLAVLVECDIALSELLKNNIEEGYSNNKLIQSNKSYIIEDTESGASTLKIESGLESYYLEGNVNPYRDAKILFNSYFNADADCYIVFGIGLGYLAKEINDRVKDSAKILVYEPDIIVLTLALRNLDFTDFLLNGHKIIYDEKLISFVKNIDGKTDKDILIMHYPSIRNIADIAIKEKIETLFIRYSSIRNQMFEMLTNFKSNVQICNHYVDELQNVIKGKDVYIVAAGPSLDKNVHLLKNKPKDSLIIAVGRIFRKLYKEGVDVDYVVFLDSADRIYGQYKGLEDTGVPLIIATTAARKIAVKSKSVKYLICQNGLLDAEKYAKERGFRTYNTGGSVATIAFDMSVTLGAKRIIMLGLDLAYCNNKTHADGANSKNYSDTSGFIRIKGIEDNMVYTTKIMNIYKIWFEERISELTSSKCKTEFLNATEGGANICGMENVKLMEIIGQQ